MSGVQVGFTRPTFTGSMGVGGSMRGMVCMMMVACTGQVEDTSFTYGLRTENLRVPACDPDAAPAAEVLTPTLLGSESIGLVHTGYRAQCCAQFEVRAVVLTGDSSLRISYTDQGTSCDCTCQHTLDYELRPMPAGTWQILAEGMTGTVTVP